MKFKDEFACWEFQGFGTKYKQLDVLYQLNKEQLKNIYNENFSNLEIVINELKNEKLLIPKRICFGSSEYRIDSNKGINNIKKIIHTNINTSSKNCLVFHIEGDSILQTKSNTQIQDGIISISYELWSDLISISTHHDLWIPIKIHSEFWSNPEEKHIDINSALINSSRLESTLYRIKTNGNFINIFPDEYQLCEDYMIKQKGFRMYYRNAVKKNIHSPLVIKKIESFFTD